MITVEHDARDYLATILAKEEDESLALRLNVYDAGTPRARCDLSFCHTQDVVETDVLHDMQLFALYVARQDLAFLRDAVVSTKTDDVGAVQLKITAPHIRGDALDPNANLFEKVSYIIDTEVNPSLAAHRGMCRLVEVTDNNEVVLQFGGGCHGCGMVDVTLKQGIEKNLKQRFPEITRVLDATDHAAGTNPYYAGGAE